MRLETAEHFVAGVEHDNEEVLRIAIAAADVASLTLRGMRLSPWPGKKAMLKVSNALGRLPLTSVESMLVAKTWLAASGRNQLVVKFRLDRAAKSLLVSQKPLCRSYGDWEDIALFSRDKVLLWSCTHENDLVISGEESWLLAQGLTPRPSLGFDVEVQPVEREFIDEICRLAKPPFPEH